MLRRSFFVATAATVLLVTACAKGGPLSGLGLDRYAPDVKFDKFNVKSLTFQQVDTAFVFDVKNNVPIKLPLGSFTWNLALGGNDFLKGNNPNGFTLEPNGTSKLRIPVSVVFTDLIAAVTGLQGKDTVPFNLSGRIGIDTPLGELKIPYRSGGDFPVLRIPKIQLGKLRVEKLDVLGHTARLAVDLNVSHEQASAMQFLEFDYDFKLGGKKVVSGLMRSLADVPPGQTQKVSIPINIDLLAVGTTIATAITTKSRLDVGLDAGMNVKTPFGDVPLNIVQVSSLNID